MLLAGTLYYAGQARQARRELDVLRESVGRSEPPAREAALTKSVPRLVAVEFYYKGCPYTEATEPVFAKLAKSYSGEPIMFVRYDMTNENTQCLSRCLFNGLGLCSIYEGDYQSGMIKLIDRTTGKVLDTLTDKKQAPQMRLAVSRALH